MKKKSDKMSINKTVLSAPACLNRPFLEPLSESEEKYQNILKNMQEGYFEVDLAGNYTFFNDSLCRIHGYSREELTGMNNRQYTDQEVAKKVFKAFNEVYKTGTPIKEIDWQITRQDGTKRYIEASVSLRQDLSGKPIGFRGIVRDITERQRTERILRENEERLRGITQNLPGVIFQFYAKDSGEYGLSYFSEPLDKFSKILANADKINVDGLFPLFLSRIHEEDKEIFIASIKTAAEAGTPWNFEGRVNTQSGEIIWIQGLSTPTREGDRLIFNGILLNITGLKLAEEKSRSSEEKFHKIFMITPDCIAITRLKDGLFIDVNKAYEDMVGWKREDVIGTTSSDPRHNFWVDPAARKLMVEDLKTGRDILNREFEFWRSDGSVRTGIYSARSINIDGEECLIFILQDITERKKSEKLIRESDEKYRLLADHMKDQVWLMDMDLQWTYISPSVEKLLGYSMEELRKIPLEKIITATSLETVVNFFSTEMSRALTAPPTYFLKRLLEIECRGKDGRILWIESSFSFIRDENGKPLSILGEGRDVTERKQAEGKLQQTLESLRKAFNTTINVMISAIEMRDPYTAGHQKKSADFARAIATEMGLAPEKIDGIRMAGTIHDIGKLSIPAEILTKPTKLTNIEFSLIKEHSRCGYEMLKDVESPWKLAEIVYQHHERMNGSGYPRNMKGDEILIEARILAVADVVEAMASHRPYRASLGIEAALEEIEKNKGILYDDNVVNACLKLFREKGYQLP
ncbi:MAG: PAS domain S-box protein [Smithella sp.]|jgi:PAS domain S-box-containing protein